MSELIGEVDRFPWLNVLVETHAGRRSIRFCVDTGFDGELAIPRSYSSFFGSSEDTDVAEFADGVQKDAMVVQCRVDWIDGWRLTGAMYIDGARPLLGMELLENCFIEIDTTVGAGEIIIRSNG